MHPFLWRQYIKKISVGQKLTISALIASAETSVSQTFGKYIWSSSNIIIKGDEKEGEVAFGTQNSKLSEFRCDEGKVTVIGYQD